MRPGDLDCFHCRLPMLYGTISKAALLDDCWTRLVRKYEVIVLGEAATRAHDVRACCSPLSFQPRQIPTRRESHSINASRRPRKIRSITPDSATSRSLINSVSRPYH